MNGEHCLHLVGTVLGGSPTFRKAMTQHLESSPKNCVSSWGAVGSPVWAVGSPGSVSLPMAYPLTFLVMGHPDVPKTVALLPMRLVQWPVVGPGSKRQSGEQLLGWPGQKFFHGMMV